MKPKYNSSKLLNNRFGASIATIITVCFSTAGMALATDWVGDTSTDWNNNLNWAGDAGTGGSNAVINAVAPNIATISANVTANPVDIFVGNETGNTGRLDHTAGTAQTGGGNWMFVGRRGSTGTYNLANPAGSGGVYTGKGQGSGSMTVGGRLYVGGYELSAANGVANVHTTGTLAMGTMLQIGVAASTGEFNLDSGTVTLGTAGQSSWFEVGNGVNAIGRLRISGGSITKIGNDHFSLGTNGGNGTGTLTGGTLTINNEIWVGQRPNSVGELNISPGATITNNSWVAIGREGGDGVVNMTGGTWNKTGASNFIIGASQADSNPGIGIMNMSGGTVTVAPIAEANRGITWIGEQNLSEGTLNLSGTATFTTARMTLAEVTGSTGTLNLNVGGTLRVGQLTGGGGTATANFDGGKIVATSSNPADFITGLDVADIKAGGLTVDTDGKNAIAPQVFIGSGQITKLGAGKLTLTGANTATSPIVVSAGSVISNTAATGSGNFTVANGAGMGVIQTGPTATLNVANVAMGTSAATSIDVDLGNTVGNPTVAPLTVGNISLAGTVTVNIADAMPAVGTSIPIIAYTSKSGVGSFSLGTLPLGVSATLTDNNAGLVFLNVTSVKIPRWTGAISDLWDTATLNWIDLASNAPTTYADNTPVLFDDNATGSTDVVLNTTVAPSKVTFANTTNVIDPAPLGKNYTLTGGGKITGSTVFIKQGAGDLTIETANDYTGATTLEGGNTTINSIANAGVASSIGASAAAASNLVLNATRLNYTGAAATTNRGFTIAGANTIIENANDLTFSGAVASTGGNLTKSGAGTLTLSNPGANVISQVNQGIRVTNGTLAFQGSGTQTNAVAGEMWVANTPDFGANVVVNGAALNVASWIAIGRGNGSVGNICNMTVTNSTVSCNNFSTGFGNGIVGNNATQNVTVTGSTWNNTGVTYLAESEGSTATMTLAGASTYNGANNFLLSRGAGTNTTLNINGTSSVVHTVGYASLGEGGTAVVNLNNSGNYSSSGDVNIGDVGTSNGTVNHSSSGTFSVGATLFVGKGATTSGTYKQTAGVFNGAGWVSIARFTAVSPATGKATGLLEVTGTGIFNQNGAAQGVIVGEEGTGVLKVATGGTVNIAGTAGLVVSNNAAGEGTVNLDAGGTLSTKRVSAGAGGAGVANFNFNGGTLTAGTGANADFFAGMDTAVINGAGNTINSNGNDITINQTFTGDGGLTKSGAGTLFVNGGMENTGNNVVTGGTLGGVGYLFGPLTVNTGASINPGAPLGVLSAPSVTFNAGSSLTIDLDASADTLAAGTLVLNNTALVLNGTPTLPVYLIARYVGLTGTFSTAAPAGYTYNYNYPTEDGTHIALVQSGGGSPYSTWINTFFPGETNPAIIGATADPDKDGNTNILEFALGGAPNSGSNNAKVYSLQADGSVDGDTNKELLLTIAVRSGTPAFTPATGGSPTATRDGAVYAIQGSLNLSGFATGVTVVAPVPPASNPDAPAGYEYRTFSLDGSNNLTGKGFLRATVNQAP